MLLNKVKEEGYDKFPTGIAKIDMQQKMKAKSTLHIYLEDFFILSKYIGHKFYHIKICVVLTYAK